MKLKNKKAQMEIIGLVVIVILISIGMLFYLRFGGDNDAATQKQDFVQKEIAVSTLNSLLQTRTECNNYDVKHLIKQVVSDDKIDCGTKSVDLEDLLIDVINNTILAPTLPVWGKEYKLTIAESLNPKDQSYILPNKIISPNFEEICSLKRKDSSLFFLSKDRGNGKIYITLEVCSTY